MPDVENLLALELSYSPRVNFAMYRNYVPLVQQAVLRNTDTVALEGVTLTLEVEPAVAKPFELRVPSIRPGGAFSVERLDIELVAERLAAQADRERGHLRARVETGGRVALERTWPLEVLPFDEWGGDATLPEILAAFVQRNHPKVAELLRRIDSALEGYESQDPERARATIGAIWGIVADLGLSWVGLPADYARTGVRIRTPDRVLAEALATGLDLAMLLAACFESCGLNPIVVLSEQGALAGAWLVDECFSAPVIDSESALRKRLELGYLELVDPRFAAAGVASAFAEAAAAARGRLDDRFLWAVDVRAARNNRILPVPSRAALADFELRDERDEPSAASSTGAPVRAIDPAADPAGRDRIEVWKHRLLDLSLRNRLLNFRPTKRTIPLMCPDLGALEDALAGEGAFSVHAREAQMGADDPRDAEVYRERHGESAEERMFHDWLGKKRLWADLAPDELEQRLVGLYRAARASLEETGANTLYLALGFLEWYETPASALPRRAPLLLLPLELTRRTVRTGFRIRLADDDPRVNVTLIKKLEVDFGLRAGGLGDLPEDERGLDVARILGRFREAALALERWRVVDEAWIGTFSFTKFLMFTDLERRGDLLKRNAVIQHLVDAPGTAFPGSPIERAPDLDAVARPQDVLCPMLADSSQLEAILQAAAGRSFVLEGPPGTGKSQTITNLIAHCLAAGKRVLFVSEKRAALEVVQRRLAAVGLDDFCLELHSNKAKKRQVLAQLDQALRAGGLTEPEAWERTAARLEATRRELNDYCDALHRERALGVSAFDGIARLVAGRDTEKVPLDLGSENAVGRERFEQMQAAAAKLAAAAAAIAPVDRHPFAGARVTEWDRAFEQAVGERASALAASAAATAAVLDELTRLLGVGVRATELSALQITRLADYTHALAAGAAPARELWTARDPDALCERLARIVASGKTRDALRADLSERWDLRLLELDLDGLLAGLRRARATVWPLSWLRARAPRKQLAGVSRGRLARTSDVVADLEQATELRECVREIEAFADEGRRWFGESWSGGEPSWSRLDQRLLWVRRARHAHADLRRALGSDPARHVELGVDGEERERALPELTRDAERVAAAWSEVRAGRAEVEDMLQLDPGVLGRDQEEDCLERLAARARAFVDGIGRLREYTAYARARREVVELDLEPLATALERGELHAGELEDAFEASFFEWWTPAVLAAESLLSGFSGVEHDHRVETLAALDDEYLRLARDVVRARLASRLPRGAGTSASDGSEVGLLQRQLALKRRHLPVRKLFQRIPHLLPRLAPCMLMSPLSVAQYLDTAMPPFDLIVFDEASQIPVQDAVGAIARGEHVVVVGDSKQLPPTTFFMRDVEDGELDDELDDELVEELESILDECNAVQLPKLDLRWHYRSRHESLIAFSNHHYYGNDLQSFPSAWGEHPAMGVSWRHVPDGVYDRSHTSTNRAEAEAIVAEVRERVQSGDRRSAGIVTFSQKQQTLVEDLLDRARRDDAALDEALAVAGDEPLFVKNLENVQGDERDVILFSVCYGPDANGRVFMNFGPLNKPGGERRLNVAVTRAREQVVVFSTLRPDQIELSRVGASALGVRHLKSFLEYAARGAEALGDSGLAHGAAAGGMLLEDIASALRGHGLDVRTRIGFSGYRVDVAVADPSAPGRYLFGVECDGPAYRRARSARDRDRLRRMVLARLGWKLARVWSPDWLYERDRQVERLLAAIAAAREPAAEAPAEAEPEAAAQSIPEPTVERSETVSGPSSDVYVATGLGAPVGIPDDFFEDGQSRYILDRMRRVIDSEAPISEDLLQRRVAPLWQIKRITSRVQRRVADLLATLDVAVHRDGDRVFVWRGDQDPETWDRFRRPVDVAGERESADLPSQEIAEAAFEVLRGSISIERDALVRETARRFAIHRAGRRVTADMERGIERLVASGRARVDGGRVVLIE